MKITPDITIVPYLHGKIFFARQVRELCLKQTYNCFAVDIPSVFQDKIQDAVEKLPVIHTIIAGNSSEDLYYIPLTHAMPP